MSDLALSENEYSTAKRLVWRRLAIRGYATEELRRLLAEKGISAPTITKVIEECTRLGYCNDVLWVEEFIRSHQARKCGPRAIVMKLKAKGISEELISNAMGQLQDRNIQRESIKKLLVTRYKARNLSDFKERQKVIASLLRRGFSLEEIRQSLCVTIRVLI